MFVSPYHKVGGIVWFARMLRKIRLHAEGKLPADYHSYMGRGFDARCVKFLKIDYSNLVARVEEGGTDEQILDWCFAGRERPSEFEMLVWNEYMIKRGWRDTDTSERQFQDYKSTHGLEHRDDIETYFDFFEVDEGRKP